MIFEYLNYNCITILILAAIIIMTVTNSENRIKGTGIIYAMTLITFIISIAEFAEVWVDENGYSYRILYYKAAVIYTLYPLLIMLLIYLTEGVKHKWFFMLPFFVNTILSIIDISGTGFIYSYGTGHNYNGGSLWFLPAMVEIFYILLLAGYSIRYLRQKNISKGVIVMFMTMVALLTQLMTMNYNIPNHFVPAACAIDILTYYFYLSAIQYINTERMLAESRIRLEHNKTNLLMAQLRPHFINSNLAVIRSLCYDEPEQAIEMIDHFSEYLRENIKQIDDQRLVSFEKEMESVDNYIYLEMQRFRDRLSVIKDFEVTDFEVPPLAVETIVENAVRHGISMTGHKGTIRISTEKGENEIIITVSDNGKGFNVDEVDFDGVNHVGIKNVKDRFSRMLGGTVLVESKVGEGTTVTFHIPVI